MLALLPLQLSALMALVSLRAHYVIPILLISPAQLVLPSALTDLANQQVHAHFLMVALPLLHLSVPLVIVSILQLQTAQSPNVQLMLLSNVWMVSVQSATSSVSLPSLMLMPRPASMQEMVTSFLVLMVHASALLTSADLFFLAQVANLSAATTEAAELSALNALRVTAALPPEATDALTVSVLKTPLTAHNLMAAQLTPALSARLLVIAPPTRLFARPSTTPPSFLITAQPTLHTSAQLVTVLPILLAAQLSVLALMVKSSAQIKSADLSGHMILSSLNLKTTTVWPPLIIAHQPASSALTWAAKPTGQTARPRTAAPSTLHSNAVMVLASLNQLVQTDALQVSPVMPAFHTSALMVHASVIQTSVRSLLLARPALLWDALIEPAQLTCPLANPRPFAQSPLLFSAKLAVVLLKLLNVLFQTMPPFALQSVHSSAPQESVSTTHSNASWELLLKSPQLPLPEDYSKTLLPWATPPTTTAWLVSTDVLTVLAELTALTAH
jgi:hypothetical protein